MKSLSIIYWRVMLLSAIHYIVLCLQMKTAVSPSFSCHYVLSLAEAQEGFRIATLGKNPFTRYLTPLLSVAIIAWGVYLHWKGLAATGQYFIILGAVFLLLQLLLRLVVLPKLFAHRYKKYSHFEQGSTIELYQQEAVLSIGERQQRFSYQEVARYRKGKLCYVIELKSRLIVIVSQQAVAQTGQQQLFERTFQTCRKG